MKSAASWMRRLAFGLLALVGPALALAQDDPPGRVGRIAEMSGSVSTFDNQQGQWIEAVRNRPLTNGDRIATDPGARVEMRIGSTTLRLGGGSELEVMRLDDDRLQFQLHSGSLALRVRSREVADETEIVTGEARLHPLKSGHYRIDRVDDSTFAAAWRGELRVEDPEQPFTVDSGRRAEIWREGGARALRRSWTAIPTDEFGDWVARDDRRDERTASNRYVSPEMTGAEDLDRYGAWEQHPEYGALWVPQVVVGWAPYRYGHWAWIAPWGWTWVDDAPWGFAPFHYGRWVSWRGRWCWSPGQYVARPVYAPALVAWVGGSNFSVSINVGGPALPAVGWVPLAPREVYVPYYRATPVYIGRINHHPRPLPPPREPMMSYANQGVPNAVTVVPRDVLVRREPVARAVVDVREPQKRALPVMPAAPVAAPPVAAAPQVRPTPGAPVRMPAPGRTPPVVTAVPPGAQQPAQPGRPAQGVVDLRDGARPDRPQRDIPERELRDRRERPLAERAQQAQEQRQERQAQEQQQAQERQQQEQQQRQVRERQLEQQRQAQERQQQERQVQERAERERQQREREAADGRRAAAERQVAERQAAERQAAERQAAERQTAERQQREQQREAAQERRAQERPQAPAAEHRAPPQPRQQGEPNRGEGRRDEPRARTPEARNGTNDGPRTQVQ